MGTGHNRQTTLTELGLERVFCCWIYFHLRSKIFFWPSHGGHPHPPMDPPLAESVMKTSARSDLTEGLIAVAYRLINRIRQMAAT